MSDKPIPERYALDHRTLSGAPVPSEAREERDRQYEFNIGQIAKQAALEQQLSEAREERDEFRERLKSMREANASLVEQRTVSTLRLAQIKAKVDEQAATIAALANAINGLLLVYEPRFAPEDGMPISIGSSRRWQDEISAAKKAAGVALANTKTNGTICDWMIREKAAKATIQELTNALQGLKRMRYEACDDSGAWEQADAALAKVKYDPST